MMKGQEDGVELALRHRVRVRQHLDLPILSRIFRVLYHILINLLSYIDFVHTHTHTHTYIYVYIYIHIYIYTYVFIYIYIYIYIYYYIYIFMYIYM